MAAFRARAAQARPVIILPYRGYGNAAKLVLPGRVLEDEGFRPTRAGERRWRNFATFLKLIESDEVPYARLRARYRGVERQLRADKEGYFRVELGNAAPSPGWQPVELELVDQPTVRTIGRVLSDRKADEKITYLVRN